MKYVIDCSSAFPAYVAEPLTSGDILDSFKQPHEGAACEARCHSYEGVRK